MEGLRLAVRKFLRGEYDFHNGKFLPTTAELSKAVKYEDNFEALKRRQQDRLPQERQENVVQIEFSDDHKRKMAERFKNLSRNLGGNSLNQSTRVKG